MSYNVLYITFNDLGDVSSASGVRPYRMYRTFLKMGYNVKLLQGQQNRRKQRRRNVKAVSEWLDDNIPDYCYIELPTGPIFNKADKKLIKKIHSKNIPIGVFYRDMHWKYPDWAWADMSKIKKTVLICMHKSDLMLFKKCCDIVYMPSKEVLEKFSSVSFKKKDVLPPGCGKPACPDYKIKKKIFYVGGVRYADGVDDALEAVARLNDEGERIEFVLVTKKEELIHLRRQDLLDKEWLTLDEGSGEYLEQYYAECDLGILPKKRHFYMDMAISVKTLEYISHNLPVLSTDCPAMARFIEDNKCGIICKDNPDSIGAAISEYYRDNEKFKKAKDDVYEAALRNAWENRINKISMDLMNQ